MNANAEGKKEKGGGGRRNEEEEIRTEDGRLGPIVRGRKNLLRPGEELKRGEVLDLNDEGRVEGLEREGLADSIMLEVAGAR